jgi:uncharacterized repeat protein (TIGR01451 family)
LGEQSGSPSACSGWWLILALFVVGAGLCVAAFVTDAHGWGGLGPSALLQFGGSIGLVGVLFIIERSLLHEIRTLGDVVTLNVHVRRPDEDEWDEATIARPGEQIEYMIRFTNAGDTTLKDVVAAANLPRYLAYVAGSTWLRNGAHPTGIRITSDDLSGGGIVVGSYEPGAVGYVRFALDVDPLSAFEGVGFPYVTRVVGIVRPAGMNEHYNVAKALIDVPGAELRG